MRGGVVRWSIRAVLLLVVGIGVAVGVIVSGIARGPVLGGELTFAGLSEPVEVLRDEYGIPYIFAKNTPDLIRAQGFVVAQARIFQMEAYRAYGAGRLAEVIGPDGLARDREMRTLGVRRNAERHAQRLSPAARNFLEWYAQGVNAYLTQHADDLPVELKIAGFTPTPWTIVDMVAWLHIVNNGQAANYRSELLAQRLIDKLGPDRARELLALNVNPDRQRKAVEVTAAPPTWLGLNNTALDATPGVFPAAPLALGSNNWAIAPVRSASRQAVVVNDPHLDARILPGVWFPVGLFSPNVHAIGAALPGLPGIFVGRNANVAFGVTNAYGDSQDLFIEQLAPGRTDAYLDGDEVRPFETITETIRVRDKEAPGGFRDEPLTIRRTVRGPIVAGPGLGATGDKLLSLRTAAAEVEGGDIGIDALLTANNATEVDLAVQKMDVMYFNFVFADKAGTIGHRASGRVPIRASGQGAYPKSATRESDWRGFIPPDQMPGQLSPARGWVATANNDTRPDGYPYDYSSFFSPSYRYERIGQVLDASRTMALDDQRALLTDTLNLQARHLLPLIIAAIKEDPAQADLAVLLAAWDGRDRLGQAAPLVYHRIYERLAYETFVDELGEDLARAYLADWYMWQERFDRLVMQPDSPWFDDQRTPAVEKLPDLIRRTVKIVRDDLQAQYGSDMKNWKWGNEHTLSFVSPLRTKGFGKSFLGAAPREMDGSGETVMRARSAFMKGFDVEFFASMRLVADLADDEKIQAVVSGGTTERQFHPNQKDQLAVWLRGDLLPWWFARPAIEKHARHRQLLTPAPR